MGLICIRSIMNSSRNIYRQGRVDFAQLAEVDREFAQWCVFEHRIMHVFRDMTLIETLAWTVWRPIDKWISMILMLWGDTPHLVLSWAMKQLSIWLGLGIIDVWRLCVHHLRQLTKSLLKRDFNLDIELPADRLCPPVRFGNAISLETLKCWPWIDRCPIGLSCFDAFAVYFAATKEGHDWCIIIIPPG